MKPSVIYKSIFCYLFVPINGIDENTPLEGAFVSQSGSRPGRRVRIYPIEVLIKNWLNFENNAQAIICYLFAYIIIFITNMVRWCWRSSLQLGDVWIVSNQYTENKFRLRWVYIGKIKSVSYTIRYIIFNRLTFSAPTVDSRILKKNQTVSSRQDIRTCLL